MKKVILAISIFLAATISAEAKQVIAIVNGKDITKTDIESALAQMAELVDGGAPKLESFPKDFQKEFINKYIDKMLIVEAARKAGAHNDPAIRKNLKEAEDYLAQQKYLGNLVLRKKDEKALQKIYDEEFGEQKAALEVHASHILVQEEAKAKELKKQLDKGADFAKLAKENSIEPGAKVSAGDLDYFVKEDMVPDFSTAAFKLKTGEVSEPVKTGFGWHLIKVHDKRKKKQITFKEAKPALEQEYARRIIDEKVSELRKSAKIDYKIDLEPEKKPEPKVEAKKPEIKKVKAKAEAKKVEVKAVEKKEPSEK